jgi:hypothetical protein
MSEVADKKVAGEGDGEEEEAQVQEFKYYLQPAITYIIIEKEWVLFTLVTALVYCIHLVWMCYGVDVYASYERHILCGDKGSPDDASSVYDLYIVLCVIFHMVEWIRQTIFATSALVGVDLVGVYYVMAINVPFGIVVTLAGAIAGVGSDSDCQEK